MSRKGTKSHPLFLKIPNLLDLGSGSHDSRTSRFSSSVYAVPVRPARAVRPTRCTQVVNTRGTSYETTQSMSVTSIPRDVASVLISLTPQTHKLMMACDQRLSRVIHWQLCHQPAMNMALSSMNISPFLTKCNRSKNPATFTFINFTASKLN